jgi:transposase
VPNDDEGIRSLVEDLRSRSCGLIVLEATGGFEIAVVVALAAAGLPVVVANPRQVRNFARPPANWPRPTAWTPAYSRCSQSACGRKCGALPDDAARLLDALLTRRRQISA